MKILYILMRTDMASMNPGKAIAQGSHATSQFTRQMENTMEMDMAKGGAIPEGPAADYLEWCNQTEDFGTVLTLGVTAKELEETVAYAKELNLPCGIVTDPTYPLRDGDTTHYFPVSTCGWIFGEKETVRHLLGWFELHP
jgi:peptidyl-tRNA hydrolase